jgi:hypothetical protein
MQGTILVYGSELMLVRARGLILKKAGYRVFSSTEFAGAMLALMNQRIDVLLLCQSLRDDEWRDILETAHAIGPEIKCALFGYHGREVAPDGSAEHPQGNHSFRGRTPKPQQLRAALRPGK